MAMETMEAAGTAREARPEEALAEILDTVGRGSDPEDLVSITGSGPVLPTNFLPEVAGAAAVAATGVAVSDIWRMKTGRGQAVSVTRKAGAAAVCAVDHLTVDGGPPDPLWDPVSGFWQGRDGRWCQLHCNYPHHRDGAMKVLGCEADPDAVRAAVAKWDMPALEDAMAEAGMCASFVRTPEEWREHPHAAALATLPLMEIVRIGDSDPEPIPDGPRPLSGIRVLDLTRVLAGPTCGRTLAEHGASVMRIAGPHLPFVKTLVMDTGHGKLSAHLDLRDRDDHARLLQLVKQSDVFSQGYRPNTLAERGLSPEELARHRPGLIYMSLCAYSHAGPWSARRGFDTLVQSASGIATENGTSARPKHMPGNPLDYVSGYLGAFGVMVALRRRAREGGSYLVRVSLAQTGRWIESLGRVQGPDARRQQPLTRDDLADLLLETKSPFGRLSHVGPAIRLSETPPHWTTPPVPLGTHRAEWPE